MQIWKVVRLHFPEQKTVNYFHRLTKTQKKMELSISESNLDLEYAKGILEPVLGEDSTCRIVDRQGRSKELIPHHYDLYINLHSAVSGHKTEHSRRSSKWETYTLPTYSFRPDPFLPPLIPSVPRLGGYDQVTRTLYIYFDVTYVDDSSTPEIFRDLIEAFASMRANLKKVEGLEVKRFLMASNYEAIRNLTSGISYASGSASDVLQEYHNLMAKIALDLKTIETLEKSIEGDTTTLTDFLNPLKKINGVEDIVLENNILSVFTDSIFCPEKSGNMIEMGKYRIDIYPSSSKKLPRCYNLTRTARGYDGEGSHHPHISRHGIPCWGSIAGDITKMHTTGDYYSLIVYILIYLGTINYDDTAGKYIVYWEENQPNSIKKINQQQL